MTKYSRSSTGKYSIKGKSYEMLIGSRAQVWHGTAYKTSGGLVKGDLFQNKIGRIVSRSKHNSAKKENRLKKYGYTAKKGQFGAVRINSAVKTHRSSRKKSSRNRSQRKRR